MRSVSLLAEAPHWINYDLPEHLIGVALKGKYRGQTQKWFAFRFEGDEDEIAINPPPGGHSAEFDRWAWKPMPELPELIVPFKRKVYEQVVGGLPASGGVGCSTAAAFLYLVVIEYFFLNGVRHFQAGYGPLRRAAIRRP